VYSTQLYPETPQTIPWRSSTAFDVALTSPCYRGSQTALWSLCCLRLAPEKLQAID